MNTLAYNAGVDDKQGLLPLYTSFDPDTMEFSEYLRGYEEAEAGSCYDPDEYRPLNYYCFSGCTCFFCSAEPDTDW